MRFRFAAGLARPALLASTLLLVSLAPLASNPAFAQADTAAAAQPLQFRDSAEERRFRALVAELRCVMCQNQSLADSDAMIARDLRREILQLMRDGRSDEQIKQFLVQRYTDFVLYRPEVSPLTWLLWFGPGVLIIGGGFWILRIVRRHARGTPAAPPSPDNQEW